MDCGPGVVWRIEALSGTWHDVWRGDWSGVEWSAE